MAKKVPVVLQLEMVECGAASLAMVMAYYKKWVPLERLRVDCGVSRDGSSAKAILKVARMYGFDAQGFKVEPDKLHALPMPCIIHWNMNHFVVLTKLTTKLAYINDPARGEVKVPIEQFGQSFTGVTIAITPGENFAPGGCVAVRQRTAQGKRPGDRLYRHRQRAHLDYRHHRDIL